MKRPQLAFFIDCLQSWSFNWRINIKKMLLKVHVLQRLNLIPLFIIIYFSDYLVGMKAFAKEFKLGFDFDGKI